MQTASVAAIATSDCVAIRKHVDVERVAQRAGREVLTLAVGVVGGSDRTTSDPFKVAVPSANSGATITSSVVASDWLKQAPSRG